MPGGFREGEKSSRQGSGQESRGLAVGVGFVLLCLCEAEIWLLFYNAAVFRPKGDFLEELEKKAYIPLRKKAAEKASEGVDTENGCNEAQEKKMSLPQIVGEQKANNDTIEIWTRAASA